MSNTPTAYFHLELNKSVEEPQSKKILKSYINKIKEFQGKTKKKERRIYYKQYYEISWA